MGPVLFFGLVLGGVFVGLSFIGGFAAAIVSGGRENRTLISNFGIGLAGWLAASLIWTGMNGGWPEEISAGMLALTFVCSIGAAFVLTRIERRRESRPAVTSG